MKNLQLIRDLLIIITCVIVLDGVYRNNQALELNKEYQDLHLDMLEIMHATR